MGEGKRKPRLPRRILCRIDGPTFGRLREAAEGRARLARAAGRSPDVTLESQAERALTGALRLQVTPAPAEPGARRELLIANPAADLVEVVLAAAKHHGLHPAEAAGRLIGAYLRLIRQVMGS